MTAAVNRRYVNENATPEPQPAANPRGGERRLLQLARSCGIATSYSSWGGTVVRVGAPTLVRLVNALSGARLPENPAPQQVLGVLDQLHAARRAEGAPPVIIAWDGKLHSTWLWLDSMPERISAVLQPENNGGEMIPLEIANISVIRRGDRFRVRAAWKRKKIPSGYYLLEIQAQDRVVCCSLLISAPQKIGPAEKGWGIFTPTYALPSDSCIGGFRELKEAAAFVRRRRGSFISTLPLLATAYEGKRADPSPYAPLSRLFWNEIFLDVPGVRGSSDKSATVDYERAYQRKKKLLQRAANAFFRGGEDKKSGYLAFAAETPFLDDYALFRAEDEPKEKRDEAIRFHKYAQFLCHQQLDEFRSKPEKYAELYLDYPVGVHQDGFDMHRFHPLFMQGVQVGAPPDMFFSKGQNWGFQPPHPLKMAEDRFRYFRATLRNYFRYARMLRLDHIMGLYRLYCIPEGFAANHGAYVHYPFEALLAVLCLEAEKHGGVLTGEDLGTVPPAVRKAMSRHGISRMWVAQLEMKPTPEATFKSIRSDMVASLNTHDLFPFAAYMKGADIGDLAKLGIFSAEEREAHEEKRRRALRGWRGKDSLLQALRMLAASPARQVVINVEDLWRETKPQNIPGTWKEYANWRRKLAFPVAQWRRKSEADAAARIMKQYGRSRGRR